MSNSQHHDAMDHHRKHLLPADQDLCGGILDSLPAYSIGLTTPEEATLVESLLPFCPEANELLADYRVIADSLLYLVPDRHAPPPAQALLSRVAAYERSLVETKPEPKRIQHKVIEPDFSAGSAPVQVTAAPKPVAIAQPARVNYAVRWLAAAAAVLILFVFGSNLYWARQIALLQAEQNRLIASLVQPAAPQMVNLTTNNHHRTLIAADQTDIRTQANFVWNSEQQIGALVVSELPVLDSAHTYQLWLVRDGHSLSLGTFSTDEAGAGVLLFHADEPIESFDHIGISTEPLGGSPTPTTPHLVIGSI